MVQKQYEFKLSTGEVVKKTLALPGNKRLTRLLGLFKEESFTSLLSNEGNQRFAVRMLDIGITPNDLREAMEICLQEGSTGLDVEEVENLLLFDEVIQDFFEQRSMRYRERAKLSIYTPTA